MAVGVTLDGVDPEQVRAIKRLRWKPLTVGLSDGHGRISHAALCCLPRTNPGTRLLYKRVNGPLRSSRDLRIPLRRPAGLVEAAHPDLADAVTLNPVCQEELYNPGREVSINPNENSILTP